MFNPAKTGQVFHYAIFNTQCSIFNVQYKTYLNELKECRTALKFIRKKEMIKPVSKLDKIYKETEELIAIVATSITTAKKNENQKGTSKK